MYLAKFLSKSLAHVKTSRLYTGTPGNVQNNCVKLSGFGVVITRLFLCREKNDKNFVSEKSSSTL